MSGDGAARHPHPEAFHFLTVKILSCPIEAIPAAISREFSNAFETKRLRQMAVSSLFSVEEIHQRDGRRRMAAKKSERLARCFLANSLQHPALAGWLNGRWHLKLF
jgi:hypothetical protein